LNVIAGTAFALSSDREKPMNVKADRVEINDRKGVSVYRGNVVIKQGTMRIEANKVTVIHTRAHKVKKLIASGKPTRFKQLPDNKTQYVHASANRMEYFAENDLLVMTDRARFKQGGNVFRSNKILYNVKADQVKAGVQHGGGPVNIILEPRKKK
jgi:lipopolysaccharide export system protein LptA